jgi:hypothetical protein
MALVATIKSVNIEYGLTKLNTEELFEIYQLIQILYRAGIDSGFRVENLLDGLKARV